MRGEEIDSILRLNGISVWYFIAVITVVLVAILLTKKLAVSLLIGYVMIILGETILFRTAFDGKHFQPLLFWSYEVWETQKKQVIANIILFIPFGLITGCLWKWKGIIAGIGVSFVIELLQLITRRGLFEFDDILHNMVGTVIGVCLYITVEAIVKKKGSKNGLQK